MDYRIVFVPEIPGSGRFMKEYETQEEAETALEAVALYTLALHDLSLMPDYSNYGMVQRKDGDEWVEIDGDGELI